jgi:hypothetical protein
MGDSTSASSYANMASKINSTLYSSHWNGAFVQECSARTQDAAVIVGFNDGYDDSDHMFAPTSYEVASTVSSYNNMFCNEYSINTADTTAGISGILYGRYKGGRLVSLFPFLCFLFALFVM